MAEQAQPAEQKAEPGASPAPTNGKGEGKPESDPKGAKAEPEFVPLSAHIELQKREKAASKRVAEYEAKEKEAADKAALERGEGQKFAQERDQWKARAERAEASMKAQIDAAVKGLDDEGKAFLALIAEDDLPRRWEAVQLLANKKTPAPGVGTKGGGAPETGDGLIPSSITTPQAFKQWHAGLAMSPDPKERAKIADKKSAAAILDAARKRGLA